jgi:hypothetical protein
VETRNGVQPPSLLERVDLSLTQLEKGENTHTRFFGLSQKPLAFLLLGRPLSLFARALTLMASCGLCWGLTDSSVAHGVTFVSYGKTPHTHYHGIKKL